MMLALALVLMLVLVLSLVPHCRRLLQQRRPHRAGGLGRERALEEGGEGGEREREGERGLRVYPESSSAGWFGV